jgi:hypothetical protein
MFFSPHVTKNASCPVARVNKSDRYKTTNEFLTTLAVLLVAFFKGDGYHQPKLKTIHLKDAHASRNKCL